MKMGPLTSVFQGILWIFLRANFLEQIFLETASEHLWVTGLEKFNDQKVYLYLCINSLVPDVYLNVLHA